MTPDQIDTVTTGLINMHTFLDQYGPGLLAGAIPGIGWWAMWRHQQRQHQRDAAFADQIHRIEHYANDPGARRLYDDIHNQPREEEL